MPDENPFAAPRAESESEAKPFDTDHVMLCPRCESLNVGVVPYNAAKGRAGPRAIDHMQCLDCGTQFDGSTGEPIGFKLRPAYVFAAVIGLAYFLFLLLTILG